MVIFYNLLSFQWSDQDALPACISILKYSVIKNTALINQLYKAKFICLCGADGFTCPFVPTWEAPREQGFYVLYDFLLLLPSHQFWENDQSCAEVKPE